MFRVATPTVAAAALLAALVLGNACSGPGTRYAGGFVQVSLDGLVDYSTTAACVPEANSNKLDYVIAAHLGQLVNSETHRSGTMRAYVSPKIAQQAGSVHFEIDAADVPVGDPRPQWEG